MDNNSYVTRGDITVQCNTQSIDYEKAIEPLIDSLDTHLGVLLASSYEYPGRYTRWDLGFINPPLMITAKQTHFTIAALNERGKVLLIAIAAKLSSNKIALQESTPDMLRGEFILSKQPLPEELRSQQPSVFTLLRAIIDLFFSSEDNYLGLYGAFGYDLTFQFEAIDLKLTREAEQRDLVLFLPDEIYIVDHQRKTALIKRYDFIFQTISTHKLPRVGKTVSPDPGKQPPKKGDHAPGEYADTVRIAKEAFKRGDLFEVVPGQIFYEPSIALPSELFRRLRERNPSPFGFLMNFGETEYLVGASPEMYVRVTGKRVETCPISGTIARGNNAINDAEQILKLLNSPKEASELTMCTDVDRNDKSRICEAGSVQIIGRRQIELYSRVIHTVDHVEGVLRTDYDALDAFLTHTWAVTVTGAPKIWAMQFIENHEHSPRRWYGGAIGLLGFNGDMNTGLTLRTIRIQHGIAEVRAGATLLFDSIPEEEEKETELKASALLDALRRASDVKLAQATNTKTKKTPIKKRILLVDHQDSFVHTLANYFRQTGAEVVTLRAGFDKQTMQQQNADLIVLSPGPGRPDDFKVAKTIADALSLHLPIFGVCLGLQGLVEYFGGELKIRDYPMHGKPTTIHVHGGKLFAGLPTTFTAGLYHSLYANKMHFPTELQITAEADDEVVMAIEHSTLPLWAVQFHPESLLSLDENIGMRIIENVIKLIR